MIDLNKRIEFADYVYRLDFDVLLLTETWLTTDVKSAKLFLPDNDIIRGVRPTESDELNQIQSDKPPESDASRNGGVLIAVNKTIKTEEISVTEIPLSVQSSLRVTELIGIGPLYIAVLYNQPLETNTGYLMSIYRNFSASLRKRAPSVSSLPVTSTCLTQIGVPMTL